MYRTHTTMITIFSSKSELSLKSQHFHTSNRFRQSKQCVCCFTVSWEKTLNVWYNSKKRFLSVNCGLCFYTYNRTVPSPGTEPSLIDSVLGTEVSLLTHEEVQCSLDKMLTLNTPLYTHIHILYPPLHIHTHSSSSCNYLCLFPLRSVYLSPCA